MKEKPQFFYPIPPEENKKIWSKDRAIRGAKIGGAVGLAMSAGITVGSLIRNGDIPHNFVFGTIAMATISSIGAATLDGFKPTSRLLGNKKHFPEIQWAESIITRIKNRKNR